MAAVERRRRPLMVISERTGLPALSRIGRCAWHVRGTPLYVQNSPSGWTVRDVTHRYADFLWTVDANLHQATFPTRRDALRALAATRFARSPPRSP